MNVRLVSSVAIAAALAFGSVARAAELVVPDQYPTIQQAIDAAVTGDTVLVKPGTYKEALSIEKNITLTSTDGPAVTILDGAGAFRPVSLGAVFNPNTDNRSLVRGFTITNGVAWAGGGVYVGYFADPSFENLVVRNNHASYGGGMYLGYGVCFTTISDSEIVDNVADYYGGGTYSNVSCTTLVRTRVARNVAGFNGGGVASLGFCTGVGAYDSYITDNVAAEGGGMFVSGSYRCGASVGGTNAVVARNRAESGVGGGISQRSYGYTYANSFTVADNVGGGFWAEPGTSHSLTNTILWGNGTAPGFVAGATVQGVDMEGGLQTGFAGDGTNISADPLFVDAAAGDYRLSPGSPCIDAGVTGGPGADIVGNPRPNGLGFDIGAYEYSLLQIPANVVIDPGTLTRCATRAVVTVYVTLPAGFDPAQVLVPSVRVDDAFAAEWGKVENGVLVLKFPREAFVRYVETLPDGPTTFTLTGEIPGIARFTGTATIRVKTSSCK